MRKGGNSILLSPHYVPLLRIFLWVFPFSPGGWHLLNAYCSEPLGRLYWTNRIKQAPLSSGSFHSRGEHNTPQSSGTQGESGDAGDLGEGPGVLTEKTTNAKEVRSRLCGFLILLVVLLVLPAEGRADGKVNVGWAREGSAGAMSQGAFGASSEAPLGALVPHAIFRAVQVFIYFTDLTSNTLFLPLSESNLELKPSHYSLYFSILEYLFSIFSNSLLKSSILSFQFHDYKEQSLYLLYESIMVCFYWFLILCAYNFWLIAIIYEEREKYLKAHTVVFL